MTAYGIYIDIDGEGEEEIVKSLMSSADKVVEVAVSYRGLVKEFTFDDFFKRLGFYD